jgi:hypothetical protein
MLSGTDPRKVTVPQLPRIPAGQVAASELGCNPSLQLGAAATATSAMHETRLGLRAVMSPRRGRQLDRRFRGE